MTLELTIPAPCDWINSNHRTHWAEKARRTKAWRDAAVIAVFRGDHLPHFTERVHITCTVHKTRGGRYDVANLADTAKACIDGIVQCGVIADDDNTRVIGPDMRAGDKRDKACVVVTITPIEQEKP